MKWSWRISRLAGIDIYMHATFLVLLLWVGLTHFFYRHRWEDAVSGLVFIVTLFAIVVLHELGHALTARRFGIRTRDITLLPIGGVARLERMPEDPRQELLVALAGPAVNVCLALVFFLVAAQVHQFSRLGDVALVGGSFLSKLMWVNVALAVFNLLPAFPMDGGRVLRALLALRTDYVRATNYAAGIGQAMAVLFGFIGLFANPLLILIALFVWTGAAQEAGQVRIKSALGGVPVSRVMITDFRTLGPWDPLSRAVEYLLTGWQQDFPVVDQQRLVGLLTRAALVRGLTRRGPSAPVGEVMEQRFATAAPDEPAEAALLRLRNRDWQAMPVTREGDLLGILTSENVGEYLMVQHALRGEAEEQKVAA